MQVIMITPYQLQLFAGAGATRMMEMQLQNDITSSARPNPSGTSPDLGLMRAFKRLSKPWTSTRIEYCCRDGGAVLSWSANTDSDMASYKIYKALHQDLHHPVQPCWQQ